MNGRGNAPENLIAFDDVFSLTDTTQWPHKDADLLRQIAAHVETLGLDPSKYEIETTPFHHGWLLKRRADLVEQEGGYAR